MISRAFVAMVACVAPSFLAVSAAFAAEDKGPPWTSPWEKQFALNLSYPIADGYQIEAVTFGGTLETGTEIIYLQKNEKLFRCFTVQGRSMAAHGGAWL